MALFAPRLPQIDDGDDWRSWGTRLQKVFNDFYGGYETPLYTGQLGEFLVVPRGWVPTNGANLSVPSFPALAQLLGTTFGAAPAGFVKLPTIVSTHAGFTMAIRA